MPDLWGGFPDYYGVLRVAPDASDDELRSAWRVAAKRWHPDTNDGQGAATMMRRVNEAWQVLGDRDARAVYDEVYFAWRTGSEHLADELSGRLSLQQERRQARAAANEWTRWGREDRGRWEREQRREAGDRERAETSRGAGGPKEAGADSARREGRQDSRAASSAGDGSDRAERGDRENTGWGVGIFALSVLTVVFIISVIVAIASS